MTVRMPLALPLLAFVAMLILGCARSPSVTQSTPSEDTIPTTVGSAVPASPRPATVPANVTRVIDGDTIEVEIDGRLFKVRYIGMDTPETVHPTRGVEPFGREASDRNRQLVEGKTVYLEKDVSETDRYDRLLRYVWVDGTMVNAVLVLEGYARVATYPPDVKYTEDFLELERGAREAGRGLWTKGMPAPGEEEGTGVAETVAPVSGECDPSYPDACIPSPPPDLNCADITYRRFTVLPPDPHRLDGDKDGVGCER